MDPRAFLTLTTLTAAGALLLLACSGGGGGGREVAITATDTGCTPTSLSAKAGEKLTFVVKNEAKGDREIEGIEGTRLEEVLVPSGRTRKLNYTVPSSGSTQKLKCYIPGGPQTIIELQVENAGSAGGSDGAKSASGAYDRTIDVELNEWMVKPETRETERGRIRFIARNVSTELVHELAVVSVNSKGDKKEIADVEGLKPGETAELAVNLKAGNYQLACLIAKGQENSPEDHYQKGMYTAFTVR